MPAGRKPSVTAARNRLDGDAERLTDVGQPLAPLAEIAERGTPEATLGERAQNRHDSFRLKAVRWRDIDRQRDAGIVHSNVDLDAADFLSTVDAAVKATRRRAAGSTVDDHGARFRSVPAGASPRATQPVEQPAPQAEPGPAGEQSVKRAEGDVAEQSDGPPLHAAETNAPDRHDRLAQRRSGQRRLWPRSDRPLAVLCHGLEFSQHFVDEGVNIGKRVPRARRRLGRTDGGSHVQVSMLLLTVIRSDGRCSRHRTQFNRWLQSKSNRSVRALYKQILI